MIGVALNSDIQPKLLLVLLVLEIAVHKSAKSHTLLGSLIVIIYVL